MRELSNAVWIPLWISLFGDKDAPWIQAFINMNNNRQAEYFFFKIS